MSFSLSLALNNKQESYLDKSELPIKKAPMNSQTEAMGTACLRFRALEPTAAEKLLETSFAPIPYESRNAKVMPRPNKNVYSPGYILRECLEDIN